MVGRGRAWSIGESRARHNGGGRCLSEWNETERVCIVRRRDTRSYRILMTRVTLAYLGGLTRPSTHVMLSPWKTIHGLPPTLCQPWLRQERSLFHFLFAAAPSIRTNRIWEYGI